MEPSLAIRFAPLSQVAITGATSGRLVAFVTWSPQMDADDHSSYIEWLEGALRFPIYHDAKETTKDRLVLRGSFPSTVLEGPKLLKLILDIGTDGKAVGAFYIGKPGRLLLRGEIACKTSLRAANQWGRYLIDQDFNWDRAYIRFLQCDVVKCVQRHQELLYNKDCEDDCGFNIYTPIAVSGCHHAVDKRAILLVLARGRKVDPSNWLAKLYKEAGSSNYIRLSDRIRNKGLSDLSDFNKLLINNAIARMFD